MENNEKKKRKNYFTWNKLIDNSVISEIPKKRISFIISLIFILSIFLSAKLFELMILERNRIQNFLNENFGEVQIIPKGNITDRNGEILATDISTVSIYANPSVMINKNESAKKLEKLLQIPFESILKKLESNKFFVWISRHVTPQKESEIYDLGIPGIYFKKDYKRVYPFGSIASHIVGFCDIDGVGLSGIEKSFSKKLDSLQNVELSIDVRVQHILKEILIDAMNEFKAIAANAIFINLKTAEIIGMESLPTIDLNDAATEKNENFFNRNLLGVFEPGSIFKILNVAIALETNSAKLDSKFDARKPIKIGKFTVTDFRAKNKILSLAEAFVFSSNIGSIKISETFGPIIQKKLFEKFGVFNSHALEVSENSTPLFPKVWNKTTMMSASYGYGIAISPISLITIIGSLINDGKKINPTLIKVLDQTVTKKITSKERLVSAETSLKLRKLMRDVVFGGISDVKTYNIFGKTGTAYKNSCGKYSETKKERLVTFIGGFPFKNPEYIVLVMLDSPKATSKTFGFATAGWNAAPTVAKIIKRTAPLLGVRMEKEIIGPFFVDKKK